jgi:NAD(P)-dependent dehydrogenase (short-subunit alcohol dehydrogenase family)
MSTPVWLITGTSSGFGRVLAEHVLAQGHRLVATARDPGRLADLVAIAPDRVLATALDVTRPGDAAAAVAAGLAAFGAIDVLVNNAGFSILGALEETPEADLRDTMETLFFGAVAATRAVLSAMRARGRGTIVQISSVGGLTTAPGFGVYCAAKHALEGLSECLAAEVAPFGLRVLVVEPGAFRTNLFGAGFRTMPVLPHYETTVGPIRAWTASSAGAQPGDPAKAARAIFDAVAAGAPNLRLPLGADAVASIRGKLAQITADVDAAEPIASATAF